jgi:hypothetical protein
MSKLNSLILLVKSLSRSEKKILTLYSSQTKDKKLYMILYDIIDKEKYASDDSVSEIFHRTHPNASLTTNVVYLFDLILDVVVHLNIRKSKEYELYNSYLRTKILRERGLYNDYLSLLQDTKAKAESIGDYNLLLTLQREELKSDLLDNYYHLKEDDLHTKEKEINNNLKIIRQIQEQSFLFEMLRFKIEKHKSTETGKSYIYDDLLISEMNLVSGLKRDIFEINRQHQLFQANYFINTGRYRSALESFSELNKLYLMNEKLWNNHPADYIMILEGILESLNRMKLFEEMSIYRGHLQELTKKYPYVNIILEINAINFRYSVAPYMYRKEYEKCLPLIDQYQDILIDKVFMLPPRLFLGVTICLSGIYLVNKSPVKARKLLAPIISNNTFSSLKIFRSVQLLNLIIYYELEDTDYIEAAIRSIRRKNKKANKETQIEKLLFQYLETEWKILPAEKGNTLKTGFKDTIIYIKYSMEDRQLMRDFDFSEWILTKLE